MKSKKGFTVLEVVLVLAISGLILLAILIAIPALARIQHDSDRRSSFSKLLANIADYRTNNRKALPTLTGDGAIDKTRFYLQRGADGKYSANTGVTTKWGTFAEKYLPEPFEDPDGARYELSIVVCPPSVGTGNTCNNQYYYKDYNHTQRISKFYQESFPNNHLVLIVLNAKCASSENVVSSPDSGSVAVLYRLESGGTYCEHN